MFPLNVMTVCSFHSSLDLANHFQLSCCWCILCPVRCPGCLGCGTFSQSGASCFLLMHPVDPHSIGWVVSSRLPCYLPWCLVSTRKCGDCSFQFRISSTNNISDDICRFRPNWSRWLSFIHDIMNFLTDLDPSCRWALEDDHHQEWWTHYCTRLCESVFNYQSFRSHSHSTTSTRFKVCSSVACPHL